MCVCICVFSVPECSLGFLLFVLVCFLFFVFFLLLPLFEGGGGALLFGMKGSGVTTGDAVLLGRES